MLLLCADRLHANVVRDHFAPPDRATIDALSSGAAARDPGLATPAPSPPTITPSTGPPDQADRLLWVWLSRVWTQWRSAVVIVRPETVIAWHRRGFRLFWTWKS